MAKKKETKTVVQGNHVRLGERSESTAFWMMKAYDRIKCGSCGEVFVVYKELLTPSCSHCGYKTEIQ